jgi:CarD family transcriptional regulator
MPSTRRAAKGRKTAAAKSRAKSGKATTKSSASSKKTRGAQASQNARKKASAAKRSAAVTKRSAKSKAKTATKKTVSRKTAAVAKTSRRSAASRKTATVASRPSAAAKSTSTRKVAKAAIAKSAPATLAPKGATTAAAAKEKAAATLAKVPATNKILEKEAHRAKVQLANAHKPVASVPSPHAGAHAGEPESKLPTASESFQVAKNISENAAKPAMRKSAPLVVPAPSGDEKATPVKATAAAKAPATAGKSRPAAQKLGFRLSEFIVYPAHGVGQIIGIEVQEVAGFSLELFVVSFVKDKMILKVPTSKVAAVGMRKLAETEVVEKALHTLSGRARVKRTMWSRRAQEYEAKINSGDLVTIAEVVRDLYRSDTQPEQSYSERQLYEAALDRMAREIAAVRKLIDSEALKLIESYLSKGPRRGAKSEAESAEDGADVDRAA